VPAHRRAVDAVRAHSSEELEVVERIQQRGVSGISRIGGPELDCRAGLPLVGVSVVFAGCDRLSVEIPRPGWTDALGYGSHQPDDPFWDWERWTRLPTAAQSAYWPRAWRNWEPERRWLEETRASGATPAILEIGFGLPRQHSAAEWRLAKLVPVAVRDLFPPDARPETLSAGSFRVDFPIENDTAGLESLAAAVYEVVGELWTRELGRVRGPILGRSASAMSPTPHVRCCLLDDDCTYTEGHSCATWPGLFREDPLVVLRSSHVADAYGGYWSTQGLRERILPAVLPIIGRRSLLTVVTLTDFNDFAARFDQYDWHDVCSRVRSRFSEHFEDAKDRLAILTEGPQLLQLAAVLPAAEAAAHGRLDSLVAQLDGEAFYAEKPDRGMWTRILEPGEARFASALHPLNADDDPEAVIDKLRLAPGQASLTA
jgi:hypothetical protein